MAVKHKAGSTILSPFPQLMISIKPRQVKTAVIILLGVATVWFFNGYPRYRETGAELLANADFHAGLARWTASRMGINVLPERGGEAKLVADEVSRSVSISQPVNSVFPGSLLRLACDIKTNNIASGERAWETARVVMFSFDRAQKAMYHRPHLLVQQSGSHDWAHVEKVFEIGSDVASVEVTAQLARSSGELWVRSFSLRPVMLKPEFKQYRLMFLCAWLIMAVWVAVPIVRLGFGSWARGAASVWTVGIVLGVLMPEELKELLGATIWPATAKSSFIASEFNDAHVFGLARTLPNLDIFKLGHFVMFALLAVALVAGKPYRISTVGLVFYLCLFATVSEILQLFMAGRSPQLGDIVIDCGGIASGVVLSGLWRVCQIGQRDGTINTP